MIAVRTASSGAMESETRFHSAVFPMPRGRPSACSGRGPRRRPGSRPSRQAGLKPTGSKSGQLAAARCEWSNKPNRLPSPRGPRRSRPPTQDLVGRGEAKRGCFPPGLGEGPNGRPGRDRTGFRPRASPAVMQRQPTRPPAQTGFPPAMGGLRHSPCVPMSLLASMVARRQALGLRRSEGRRGGGDSPRCGR